jgi:adenylosuccinate synthase
MSVDVLLGLQWGDEGKGKIVDFLAPRYQVVARFQGGPNAGHTLEFEGIKHVLHQIPSGIFRTDTRNIIGNGVVLDPVIFKKEVDSLSKYNLNIARTCAFPKRRSSSCRRTGCSTPPPNSRRAKAKSDLPSRASDLPTRTKLPARACGW